MGYYSSNLSYLKRNFSCLSHVPVYSFVIIVTQKLDTFNYSSAAINRADMVYVFPFFRRGVGVYFQGQQGLAAIFSLFAAILDKFKFLVLGPLVGPLCTIEQ